MGSSIYISDVDPETLQTFSPSQISYYMDCSQKWNYAYVDNLKRISTGNFKMDRGSYIHRLLHYYYDLKRQGLTDQTIEMSMTKKITDDLNQATADTIPLMHSALPLVENYVQNRSKEIDRGMKVLGTEYEYKVPIRTPKGRIIALHGIIDLLYRNMKNRLRIRDHKTSENYAAWGLSKVQFDFQLRMYFYVLSLYNEFGLEVEGVETNFINTYPYKNAATKPLFELYPGTFSPNQMVTFERELVTIIDLMLDGQHYRHYNKDCDRCTYFPICYREEKGLPTAGTISTQFVRVNRKVVKHETQSPITGEGTESNTEGLPLRDKADFKLSLNLSGRN